MAGRTAAGDARPILQIEGIAKCFAPGTAVFRDLWFNVRAGEFVCLIGHSGCGKTTILNILAGLDTPSAGSVIVDGEELVGPSLDRAVVFQSHALLPWMSVIENIAFAVQSRWRDSPAKEIRDRVQDFLERVHLGGAGDKRPAELSGGMRQRVGIARALAIEPKILLMDEPFSALDALTRGSLQDELMTICRNSQQTTFMITHDIDEAILLADRIVLMTSGPEARVCEIVENTLPSGRSRSDLHRHENYSPMRNHLLEFLVNRSKGAGAAASPIDPMKPPVVRPVRTTALFA
jgi:nitrate/nitrite transport system ATP-binding protein